MRALLLAAVSWIGLAAAAVAQDQTPSTKILFVGNSFTYGGSTKVHAYNAATVTDEPPGETGVGGIPAIFKQLTDEAGLRYEVHVETVGGKDLEFHYQHVGDLLTRHAWDAVVLQGYSTEPLPTARGGKPDNFLHFAALLEEAIHHARPTAKVYLYETWAYPFKTYPSPGTHDRGPLDQMTDDLRAGYQRAFAGDKHFEAVVPVGDAWAQAVRTSIATADTAVQDKMVLLDSKDHKHPSVAGSYLAALVLFEQVTGKSATALGAQEQAARDLGIAPGDTAKLQKVADETVDAGAKR